MHHPKTGGRLKQWFTFLHCCFPTSLLCSLLMFPSFFYLTSFFIFFQLFQNLASLVFFPSASVILNLTDRVKPALHLSTFTHFYAVVLPNFLSIKVNLSELYIHLCMYIFVTLTFVILQNAKSQMFTFHLFPNKSLQNANSLSQTRINTLTKRTEAALAHMTKTQKKV